METTQTTAGKLKPGDRIFRDGIIQTVTKVDQSVVRQSTIWVGDTGARLEIGKATRIQLVTDQPATYPTDTGALHADGTVANADQLDPGFERHDPPKIDANRATMAAEDLQPGAWVIWHGQAHEVDYVDLIGTDQVTVHLAGTAGTPAIPAATRFVLARREDLLDRDAREAQGIEPRARGEAIVGTAEPENIVTAADIIAASRPTAATVGQPGMAASLKAAVERINTGDSPVDPKAAAQAIIQAGAPIIDVQVYSVLPDGRLDLDAVEPDTVQVFDGTGTVVRNLMDAIQEYQPELMVSFNRRCVELAIYQGPDCLVDISTPATPDHVDVEQFRSQLDAADQLFNEIPGWEAVGPWKVGGWNFATVTIVRPVKAVS